MTRLPNLQDMLPKVECVMRATGEYLLAVQHDVEAEGKSDGTLVSAADHEAERRLREHLTALFPGSYFRGEESLWGSWPDYAWCWVVDPLDGTKEYLAGRQGWGVSIALLHGATPMLAAIHLPGTNSTFTAIKGHGAHHDGKRLRVSPVAGLLVATTRMAPVVEALFERPVKPFYAAVLLCTEVARGNAAAYVSIGRSLDAWDVAAGQLIIEEAGGCCTTSGGEVLTLNGAKSKVGDFVFSNGAIHDELLDNLQQHRANAHAHAASVALSTGKRGAAFPSQA